MDKWRGFQMERILFRNREWDVRYFKSEKLK